MKNGSGRLKIAFLLLGDIILLYWSLFISLIARYGGEPEPGMLENHRLPFTVIFVLWLAIFGAFGMYDLKFMKNSKQFLYRLLRSQAVNTVLSIVVLYLIPIFGIEPRRNLILIVILSTAFIFLWRYSFNALIIRTAFTRVLFFGITKETIELADFLSKNPQLGFRPVAFMAVNGELSSVTPVRKLNALIAADGPVSQEIETDISLQGPFRFSNGVNLPILASHQNLIPIIEEFGIDAIVISPEIKENKTLVSVLFQVIPFGVGVVEFPSFYEANTGKVPLSLIAEVWFLENLVGIKRQLYEFFKRALDLILASILIIPSAALFPFIVAAIKLDSKGSAFFTQKRVGRNGKEFTLIKYRSMVDNAQNLGGQKGNGPDERHTRVGSFLRKSYLDELPQIINVLKGNMSFIGPRPERTQYVQDLSQKIPFYKMRLLVPPGITGWAQIHMEDDASVEDAPEKMQYDLYYIKNRTFILDLLIALKTISTLIRRRGR